MFKKNSQKRFERTQNAHNHMITRLESEKLSKLIAAIKRIQTFSHNIRC